MSTEIITSSHKISVLDTGIVKDILFKADETLDKSQEALGVVRRMTGGKKTLMLVDIRQQKSITREARQYYSSKEFTDNVTALAFIVESPTSKVIANFYLGPNKPSYPTRLFTNEDEARKWLGIYLQ